MCLGSCAASGSISTCVCRPPGRPGHTVNFAQTFAWVHCPWRPWQGRIRCGCGAWTGASSQTRGRSASRGHAPRVLHYYHCYCSVAQHQRSTAAPVRKSLSNHPTPGVAGGPSLHRKGFSGTQGFEAHTTLWCHTQSPTCPTNPTSIAVHTPGLIRSSVRPAARPHTAPHY